MRFFTCLLLFIMTVNTGYTRQDTVHAQWQNTHFLPLLWDNVESAPEWIAGIKPTYKIADNNDSVHLAPGDWVVVAVSAGQWLRIINTQTDTSLNSLFVMRSVDGVSFVEEALHFTADGQQGLTATRSPALTWVRVENNESASQELKLALFISRLPEKATYPDYHVALSPSGKAEQVKISEHLNHKTYWALGGRKSLEFEVEGPLRLRLNSRLHLQEYFRSTYEPYAIKAWLDNRAFAHLEIETSIPNENSQLSKVNNCSSPLSNLQSTYLDIPEGKHRLRLKSSSQQYVELLASRDENDYLFKTNVKQNFILRDAQNDSLWNYDVDILPLLLASTTPVYQQDAAAQRMIRDNRFLPGSLRAREQMLGDASYRFEDAERLRVLSHQHTSIRKRIDLLPMGALLEGNEVLQQRVMTISPLRLSSKDSDVVLWRKQLTTLAEQQIKAKFVQISRAGGQLEYRLPQSDAARSLRIYLANRNNTDGEWGTIQLGDAAAQQLRTITLSAKMDVPLNVSPGYLAEAIVYEGKQLPAFVPNWVEVTVPAGIEKISIKAQRDDLWLALRLQQSGRYKPSERDYLATLHSGVTSDTAMPAFLKLLKQVGKDSDDTQSSSSYINIDPELVNQWWPLISYLKSHRDDFQRINPSTTKANHKAILDRSLVSQWVKAAMMAEDEKDFVSAIAHWTSAMQHSSDYKYDSLRLRRATALLKNGDTYYAEKEWWALYSGSRFHEIQDKALESTIAQVSKQNDPDRLVKVLSASLVEHPSSTLLARLVTAMVAAGETQQALYLGLLLTSSQQPVEPLLQAAASEGWWQVFSDLKVRLTDLEAQQYWSGVRYVVQGDFNAALQSWETGGQRGLQAKTRLDKALEIRQGLASPQLAEREHAVSLWQIWQGEKIENGKWRSANNYVTSYKASERLVSTALGIQSLQYEATPNKPLKLQIHGAQRLRFFVRPLHSAASDDSLDGWMVLRANQETLHVPFFNNRVDEDKQLLGRNEVRAGKSVSQEVQLDAGLNNVELNLLQKNAIVTVQLWRPTIGWSVLPDLADTQIQARYVMNETYQDSAITANMASNIQANINADVIIAEACGSSQQQVAFAEPLFLLDDAIASLDKAGLSASKAPALIDIQLKRLFSLLWKMKHNAKDAMSFAFEAVQLLEANPDRYDLQKYAGHLERHLRWQTLKTVERRAGVKRIDLLDNTPENPNARVSHVLSPVLENHQRRLKGYSKLLLALEQVRASKLKFIFNTEGGQLATNQKLQLRVKLDAEESKLLNLTNTQNQTSLILTVPAGAHSVNLRQLNPYIGQTVRVSVFEAMQNGQWIPYLFDYPSRNYHVATKEEPLIMHVRGPGRVRIDEWRDGRTLYKYQDVENGWQALHLSPDKQQKTAMYRVFERVFNETDEDTALLKSTNEVLPLSSLLPPPTFENKPVLEPLDQLQLGGQEDGTWSLTAAPTSRRNLDEDDGGVTDAEVFTEVRVSHRKYVEQADFYHHADLFLRARNDGGATTGAREWLSKLNIWRNVDLDVQGGFFVQQPNNNIGTQWSGDLRAKFSRDYALTQNIKHKASITAFNRWMSLDELPLINSMDVDQDVFTRYKHQHRHGLKFCDDVSYRPWVDSNFVANACVNSNEDMNFFDPDNFSMNLGGRFLLGSLLLRADYGATHYLSDSDRSSAITRQKLRLEADWFQWRDSRNGLQLGLRIDHDFSHNDNSVWLSLTWHRSNGRLFQDFRPSEIAFRNLRQRLHYDSLYTNSEQEAVIQ